MKLSVAPLVLLLLILLAAAETSALVIDDFSDSQFLELPLGSTGVGQDRTGSMIGGERRLTLHDTAGSASATALVTSGSLRYSTSGAPGSDFSFVSWDGLPPAGSGLGGIDLTLGGLNDRFQIDVTSLIGESASLWVHVRDSLGGASRWLLPLVTQPGVIVVDFDDFTTHVSPVPADLTSVDYINVRISLPGAGALTLASVTAVPEPSTLLLVLCGLPLIRISRGVFASR